MIKTLWPHIGKVVFKQAVEQAGPILDDVCKKVSRHCQAVIHCCVQCPHCRHDGAACTLMYLQVLQYAH